MSIVIVVPAHNEALVLAQNIERIVQLSRSTLPDRVVRIVIAENGSLDTTAEVGEALAKKFPEVTLKRFPLPAKGATIRAAWQEAGEDILFFTDADLSADISAIPVMVSAFEDGADFVIASRYRHGARVARGTVRSFGSRLYVLLARTVLDIPVSDFQCGLKAIKKEAAIKVLPSVVSNAWFFDTELVAWAHAFGMRIAEVPVQWVEYRVRARASQLPAFRVFISFVRELFLLRKRIRNR